MNNKLSLTEKQIEIFPDARTLSVFGANLFAQIAKDAVSSRGIFFTALSGGGTPMALYRLLAELPYLESLPWDKMHFFWGDERCVPPDNSESCYFQAYSMWLGKVSIPAENIHRAKGEMGPETAAADYAHELKKVAEITEDWPQFDLIFLGLGADGHTASLFPGSALQTDSQLAVIPVTAQYQDRPANRISMTPAVFNSARNVVFLVSGTEKESALAETISGPPDPVRLPAQRIRPDNGKIWWLVDEAAGRLLSRSTQ
jgi:6-phosphogluconolactonase